MRKMQATVTTHARLGGKLRRVAVPVTYGTNGKASAIVLAAHHKARLLRQGLQHKIYGHLPGSMLAVTITRK